MPYDPDIARKSPWISGAIGLIGSAQAVGIALIYHGGLYEVIGGIALIAVTIGLIFHYLRTI